jgi:hypothetical protein
MPSPLRHSSRVTPHVRASILPWLAAPITAVAAQPAGASKEPPLAGFVAQRVAVMPVQLLRADSGALVWMNEWAAYRLALDDSIGAAIAERGVGRRWAYAGDIARMARRNAAYVSDPYTLGAQSLRGRVFKPGEQASILLVSNLRSLIALGDTRFALIPVELALVRQGAEHHATIRLVLLDGRAGTVLWAGEITGALAGADAEAAAGALAQRVADLVAAR